MKDWNGNTKATFTMMGASNHSEKERQAEDFYATPPGAIDDLFKQEKFSKVIWEPACGMGHLSNRMKELGKAVIENDLIARLPGINTADFLTTLTSPHPACDIITNPPYKFGQDFVEKSMELVREGGKVAMFLKITFLESASRLEMFKKYPPKIVYIYMLKGYLAL